MMFELPERSARLGIYGFEPAVHRSIEDHVSSRGERTAPHGEFFIDAPDFLSSIDVPSSELAAVAVAWARFHADLGTDEGRSGDVTDVLLLDVHAQIVMRM